MITLIKTRYAGPTNTRSARIIVTVLDNAARPAPRSIAYDDGIGARQNHIDAALATLETLPFPRVSNWLIADDNERGFIFVPDRADNRVIFSFGE